MAYDDIIIGAGLSGLATALGLPAGRRILVLTQGEGKSVRYYDGARTIPKAVNGLGGLGNFWHGVIPLGCAALFAKAARPYFKPLLDRVYPGLDLSSRLDQGWLFVPRRPIRPSGHWSKLSAERGDMIDMRPYSAIAFDHHKDGVTLTTSEGTFKAKRIWICAGALDSPSIIEKSIGPAPVRSHVSDHAICYMGQTVRPAGIAHKRQVERIEGGYLLASQAAGTSNALVTMKPARFDYRTLDYGIEQRAAFGLPTSSVVTKLLRARSPGLIAEALFNKFGLFPDAATMSVYAQIEVPNAYRLSTESDGLETDQANLARAIDSARRQISLQDFTPSRRPDLYLKAIHLHGSLDQAALRSAGINGADDAVRVMDASAIDSVGAEHHSFYMMAAAFGAASKA